MYVYLPITVGSGNASEPEWRRAGHNYASVCGRRGTHYGGGRGIANANACACDGPISRGPGGDEQVRKLRWLKEP